jgi:hypothetical protein
MGRPNGPIAPCPKPLGGLHIGWCLVDVLVFSEVETLAGQIRFSQVVLLAYALIGKCLIYWRSRQDSNL